MWQCPPLLAMTVTAAAAAAAAAAAQLATLTEVATGKLQEPILKEIVDLDLQPNIKGIRTNYASSGKR